ncbi:MAG: hydrogenase maturation protease [Candidatus Krumholzibacteriota bacterium]
MKIFAVGNSFFGDDGVGAAVLERIRREDVFPGADLIDVHTDALALLDHLSRGEMNVVVDAAEMGLEPGAAIGFRPSEVRLKINSDHLSMHGFGLAEAFDLAAQLDRMPDDVLIVGVEPERVQINQGLSAVVSDAVPRVISIIQAEVQSNG